jgi:DMSO/TMAO reductase YedYZ molybdopterin-dependent catalytic subunit
VAFRLGRAWRAVAAGPRRQPADVAPAPAAPETGAAPSDESGLATPNPAAPTLSRRGALGMVGAGSAVLLVVTAGQSIGGSLRGTALLAPHGQNPGPDDNSLQINKTAASVGIRPGDIGPDWRLTVRGAGRRAVLTRAQLLAMPQTRSRLPIMCVEGWSTEDQMWSGVRLVDLAALVGLGRDTPHVLVESVQPGGPFSSVVLSADQARDRRSLLALHVNGAALSRDHGYPARIIVPGAPGVHNTKWVGRLSFGEPV